MGNLAELRQPLPLYEPVIANPVVDWLLAEGWDLPDLKELVGQLGERFLAIGLPVWRLKVTVRTLHPQFLGASYTWQRGRSEVDEFCPTHTMLGDACYLNSPFAAIFERYAGTIRRRLDIAGAQFDFPLLEELRAEGATDYVAIPMRFSDGRLSAATFATDRPGGFTDRELDLIHSTLPVFAHLIELHAVRRTAQTILQTYLGRVSGERVLRGLIRRGDCENIHAVIWFSDLRGSTMLAERLALQTFFELLNAYFDAMAGAILAGGGEILRFVGDAALAMFPVDAGGSRPAPHEKHERACLDALAAARSALARMESLNRERSKAGQPTLRFGIALHLGDVVYGNVGGAGRLEFTVIGAAANEAARLQSMCKTLDRPLLVSAEFARYVPDGLVSLGRHPLRDVREPQAIFALAEA